MLAFQVLYGLSFAQVQNQDELRQAFMSYPSREDEKSEDLESRGLFHLFPSQRIPR